MTTNQQQLTFILCSRLCYKCLTCISNSIHPHNNPMRQVYYPSHCTLGRQRHITERLRDRTKGQITSKRQNQTQAFWLLRLKSSL